MGVFSITQSASFAGKIFDNKKSTDPVVKMTSFKPSFSGKHQSTRLERSIPEKEGIPSNLIHSFLKTLAEDRTLNMHNIIVMRNGKILCEAAFGAQRLDMWKYTFSACKSVVSLAIGVLVDDGVLKLDERIAEIFDEAPPLFKLKMKGLTVKDLLTMRSGVLFAEVESAVEKDWIKGFLSAPTKGEIGKDFHYNSLNTYMLSAIVTRKAQMPFSEFIDKRLFSPLGIASDAWYWEKCPQGVEKGGWGLYIYPEDFCKLGQLVMQNGVWKGKQLISSTYLQEATSPQAEITKESAYFNYGYQLWVGKHTDTFLFNGMLGQNVIGFRNNGILIVSNAGNGEFFHQSTFYKHLFSFFNKPFDKPCQADPDGVKELDNYVKALSSYYKPPIRKNLFSRLFKSHRKATENEFAKLQGLTFSFFSGYEKAVGLLPMALQMVQNWYPKGLKAVTFLQEGESPFIVYQENGNRYKIPLGFDTPKTAELSFGENRFLTATQAKFKKDEEDRSVLIVRIDFLEFPSSRILKFVFLDHETILLRQSELPGKEFILETIRDHVSDFAEKPILAGIIDRIGVDFLEFKAERVFAPEIILKNKQ